MFGGSKKRKIEDCVEYQNTNGTDECYTPEDVYNAVKDWVCTNFLLPNSTLFERPFYPGGDYKKALETMPDGAIVLDNPPFSLLKEIVETYQQKGVKFFLFAPGNLLTKYLYTSGTSLVACAVPMHFITPLTTTTKRVTVKCNFYTNLYKRPGLYAEPCLYQRISSLYSRTDTNAHKNPLLPGQVSVSYAQYLAKHGEEDDWPYDDYDLIAKPPATAKDHRRYFGHRLQKKEKSE